MLKGVPNIVGRPDFAKLNGTRYWMETIFKRIYHPLYPDNGHAGAVMTMKAQALFRGQELKRPDKYAEECPKANGGFNDDAIVFNNYKVKYGYWRTSELVEIAAKAWYEDNIEKEYHFGSSWGGQGYGDNTLEQIMTGLDERSKKLTQSKKHSFYSISRATSDQVSPLSKPCTKWKRWTLSWIR